ncbi:MAG TPA: L,D-transpeptidase, partial [Allosphingosinicella sp.]|nr:L,D-transpeptidase [Allosphingosinicella sp.]
MTARTLAAKIGTGLLAGAAMLLVGFEVAEEPARAPAQAEAKAAAADAAPVIAASAPAPAPAAVDPNFTVRRILDIPGPLKMGEYHWDESGAPA